MDRIHRTARGGCHATLPCLATSNDLNQRLSSRSICRLLWGLCSVGRQRRGQREGVENVLDSEDEVLPSVEFVGHRRRIHATAGVQVPQGFARGRIESQQIAGIIGAKQEMSAGGKNS